MTPRRAAVAAAAVLLAVSPAALADEKDERIDRLEQETKELRRELAEMKASRAAGADGVRAAVDDLVNRSQAMAENAPGWYAGPGGVRRPSGNITLGGYFSTRWLAAETAGLHTFVDMRLVPQIHAQITDRIAFDTEIEIEHGGVGGPADDGEIVVEFAELSFRHSDAFKFKVGTLLVPFGWFNQNHDDPLNEFSSRPDVARYVVPSAFDSPGVGVEGMIEVDEDTAFTYDVVLNNGLKDAFDGDSGSRGARGLFEEDDNHDKTLFGRVAFIPTIDLLDALAIGVSGALGKVGEEDQDRLSGAGVDVTAKAGPWEFKGEHSRFGIDRGSDAAPPIDAAGNLGPVRGFRGYYAQLAYRIAEEWVRCLPFAEKDASVALVLKRDAIDLNDRVHAAGSRDDERAWSLGLNYRPTTKTVVKLEWRKAKSAVPGEKHDHDLFAVEFATYF
jgi:hypothetical protein